MNDSQSDIGPLEYATGAYFKAVSSLNELERQLDRLASRSPTDPYSAQLIASGHLAALRAIIEYHREIS